MSQPTRWRFVAAGTPIQLRDACDALDAVLTAHGVGPRACVAARLVCEEVVLNAFEHGAATVVTMEADPADDPYLLVFEDDGTPFDPTSPPPTRKTDAGADVSPRGRGLILVRHFTTSIDHRLTDGRNRLSVRLADTP